MFFVLLCMAVAAGIFLLVRAERKKDAAAAKAKGTTGPTGLTGTH